VKLEHTLPSKQRRQRLWLEEEPKAPDSLRHSVDGKEISMAYYKILLEVWCDWDPAESDLEEIVRHVALREDAICTLREIVAVVDRPQDIQNEQAMSFFGGQEGDADQSQG
jgi:hypothetical protein